MRNTGYRVHSATAKTRAEIIDVDNRGQLISALETARADEQTQARESAIQSVLTDISGGG